jgi:hypothetical protein
VNYHGSVSNALLAIFPNYSASKTDADARTSYGYWKEHHNQKQLFDEIGKEFGIDNTNLDGWYSIKYGDVIEKKGVSSVLSHYNCSLIQSLQNIYKDKDWQVWKFDQMHRHYWDNETHVKAYLDWMFK